VTSERAAQIVVRVLICGLTFMLLVITLPFCIRDIWRDWLTARANRKVYRT